MNNKDKGLDIYLMGIGGTGMGAFAGLLKSMGHNVRGSDSAVYSPMREKLIEWGISYKTPYSEKNLVKKPDLIIVGNVIRKDNEEAQAMREQAIPHRSFPDALHQLFLQKAQSLVVAGTHGKTTSSSLLAHTLHHAGYDPGFLIGGIPLNFNESFRNSKKPEHPFVVEGDEYDTAYFDKRPKFMHYRPNFLLLTSIEFDHGDIYRDLDAVVDAFAKLLLERSSDDLVVVNNEDHNIRRMLSKISSKAKVVSYGAGGDYEAKSIKLYPNGITCDVYAFNKRLGTFTIPLYGRHNLLNALGVYALLHSYGLSHQPIADGFAQFLGVKRRLEVCHEQDGITRIDDFAHHPSAVRETILAAKQKYNDKKIWAIFEPRSATSCSNVFEKSYIEAFLAADKVILAPLGRTLSPAEGLNTSNIALSLRERGVDALAFNSYKELLNVLDNAQHNDVLLFMSNGDFGGNLKPMLKI